METLLAVTALRFSTHPDSGALVMHHFADTAKAGLQRLHG